MGYVSPGPFRETGEGHDVPRRQHRRAGANQPALTPADHRRRLGRFGENLAARFLRARGGVIVARNVAVGRGEIDLVVRFGRTVAAVEVKTIIPSVPSDEPLDHFTPAKARQVSTLARALKPAVHRVDVVGVTVRPQGVDIRWLPCAC